MKIYISGAISNNPNFKEEFKTIENDLIKQGNKVMNPADLPSGFSQKDYMQVCIAMLNCCDAICMINDWEKSEGAKVEKDYAKKIGLSVHYGYTNNYIIKNNMEHIRPYNVGIR